MMLTRALLVASLADFALGTLPFTLPCSSISGTPCRCPFGTNYAESVTTAIIGAPAGNVGAVINDFFDPSWAGVELLTVQGPDNFPGLSIRNLNMSTSVGYYEFSERLTFRFVFIDGSFEQRNEQRGIVPYMSGNGSFSGHWLTLKGDRIFENQTLVRLSTYACQTGHPINFAAINEMALGNVTSILTAAGLLRGVSTEPVSSQLF
ncbi:hypothetical protein F4802DRAFT_599900 [Xylaria palmicola]|nr:hypothetical protein F4802DRAFT_599900 [Xylaria palmicola]